MNRVRSKFLYLCIFCALVCSYWFPVFSQTTEVPYKATSVSECVKEEECVWFAFKNFLPMVEFGKKILISKWDKPIDIANLTQNEIVSQEIKKISASLAYSFPHKISEGEVFDYVILVSDDFERDVYKKYRNFFANYFGSVVFNEASAAKSIKNLSHISIPLKSRNGSILAHVLIIKDDSDLLRVFRMTFFETLSLTSPPWTMGSLEDFRPDHYSELHNVILKILYSKDFVNGVIELEHARKIFKQNYYKALNEYKGKQEVMALYDRTEEEWAAVLRAESHFPQ